MKKFIITALLLAGLTCVNLSAQGTIVWHFRAVNYGQVEEFVPLFFGPDVDTANFVNVPADGVLHSYYLFTDLGVISGFETESAAWGYLLDGQPIPDTMVGNSYVGEQGGTTAPAPYINTGHIDSFYGEVGVNTDVFTAVEMGDFDVTHNGVPTVEGKKTVWVLEDGAATALSAGVYREGTDKTVAALVDLRTQIASLALALTPGATEPTAPDGTPLPDAGDITAAQGAQIAQLATSTGEIVGTIPGGLDGTGIDPNGFTNDTKAGSGFTFYTTPTIAELGVSFDFSPAIWWPDWVDYADLIREVFLFGMGLIWVVTQQRRFEAYFRMWWNTPEKTTKPEPAQIAIPGVGWGKQLATALYMTAALVAIIGVTITSYNSHLGSIIGSETMMTFLGMTSDKFEAISSNGLFSKAYGLLNMFVPLVAIFQFFSAHYLLGWTMPATWTAALWTAKHVHI